MSFSQCTHLFPNVGKRIEGVEIVSFVKGRNRYLNICRGRLYLPRYCVPQTIHIPGGPCVVTVWHPSHFFVFLTLFVVLTFFVVFTFFLFSLFLLFSLFSLFSLFFCSHSFCCSHFFVFITFFSLFSLFCFYHFLFSHFIHHCLSNASARKICRHYCRRREI